MAHLENVTISPNPVDAGKEFVLTVTIATWNYMKRNQKWGNLTEKKWNEVNSDWKTE